MNFFSGKHGVVVLVIIQATVIIGLIMLLMEYAGMPARASAFMSGVVLLLFLPFWWHSRRIRSNRLKQPPQQK